MLYLILFVLCIAVELSPRINTDNHIKKIGIGIIAIGALIESYGHHNMLIVIGIILYLVASLSSAYFHVHHRRAIDK